MRSLARYAERRDARYPGLEHLREIQDSTRQRDFLTLAVTVSRVQALDTSCWGFVRTLYAVFGTVAWTCQLRRCAPCLRVPPSSHLEDARTCGLDGKDVSSRLRRTGTGGRRVGSWPRYAVKDVPVEADYSISALMGHGRHSSQGQSG